MDVENTVDELGRLAVEPADDDGACRLMSERRISMSREMLSPAAAARQITAIHDAPATVVAK